MNNLNTPEGLTAYMSAATSEDDWNKRVDDVKRANNGYPSFWFATIIISGLAERTAKKWNGSGGISIRTY